MGQVIRRYTSDRRVREDDVFYTRFINTDLRPAPLRCAETMG